MSIVLIGQFWKSSFLCVVFIVCLNIEIVCVFGCVDLFVGVDDYLDYLVDVVCDLLCVGFDFGVDLEKVLVFELDLVLVSLMVFGYEKVVEFFEQVGFNVVVLELVSFVDVCWDIVQIGELLSVFDWVVVFVVEFELEVLDVLVVLLKIFVEWWFKLVIVLGEQSWVIQFIELVGGVNLFGDELNKSCLLSNEEVVEINLDVIVIFWCGVDLSKYCFDVVFGWVGIEEMCVVCEGYVFCVFEVYLGWFGLCFVDGLCDLCQVV